MLERKTRMAELSDAFLVLPGGLGTLDELFEMATWSQLRLHGRAKPLGVLDVAGYYADLRCWFDRAIEDGFVGRSTAGLPVWSAELAELLGALGA
jgi:uncharacterized protein (TIGR00730 family)